MALFLCARIGKGKYKCTDKEDLRDQLACKYKASTEQAKKKLNLTAQKFNRAAHFNGHPASLTSQNFVELCAVPIVTPRG